jgi:putative ABC transport system permease protein
MIIASFVEIVIFIDIIKAKRVKPVLTLNGLNYGETKKKKQYRGNSTHQFSAAGIAYRKFVREKRSALNIIMTCIVTIYSINFIVISLDVANTMKENNDYWIGIDKSDVMINVTDPSDYESVKDIVDRDNRTDYCLNNDMDIALSLKWKKGMNNPQFYAFVYDDYQKANLPVVEGRDPDADNEIALSTTLASELHKSIGDYIEVYLDESKKADFLITSFFQSYEHLGSVCRLTASAFSKHHMKMNYKNISVYLKSSKDMDDFILDMKDRIGGKGNVIKRTDKCESIMDMIVKPQQKAIPPVAALIMIIAGLNIFCIVYLKNIQSHRINGIYKCIGYTTWHLVLTNLYYVGALAAVSVIITLPVSLVTYSPIMRLSLSMFNFRNYPMQINIGHLMIANMIVILIFIVSTLVSSRELFKVNTRDLVQE